MKQKVDKNSNHFGRTLRAYRLGYRESKTHGCWIKVSCDEARTYCTIIAVPLDTMPPKEGRGFACWWDEKDESKNLLSLAPVLKGVYKPTEILRFKVNPETGEEI